MRIRGIEAVVVRPPDDEQLYNDPAIVALRQTAADLGLDLRLAHLGTRGQLAFAVPVAGLDYWRATLQVEGTRGTVAYELRNTALEAAQAVLASYEKPQLHPNPGG